MSGRKAECALCYYVTDATDLRGHESATDLFERGLIRSKDDRPWVFCVPCLAAISTSKRLLPEEE